MIVNFPKREPVLNVTIRGTCVIPAVGKVIPKIILEDIKKHFESLTDRKQAVDPPTLTGSIPMDHFGTVRGV